MNTFLVLFSEATLLERAAGGSPVGELPSRGASLKKRENKRKNGHNYFISFFISRASRRRTPGKPKEKVGPYEYED